MIDWDVVCSFKSHIVLDNMNRKPSHTACSMDGSDHRTPGNEEFRPLGLNFASQFLCLTSSQLNCTLRELLCADRLIIPRHADTGKLDN